MAAPWPASVATNVCSSVGRNKIPVSLVNPGSPPRRNSVSYFGLRWYTLNINGLVTASLTAKELEAGLNLTSLGAPLQVTEAGPIVVQSRAILAAVAAKEAVVSQWRSLSQKAHADGAAADLKKQLRS